MAGIYFASSQHQMTEFIGKNIVNEISKSWKLGLSLVQRSSCFRFRFTPQFFYERNKERGNSIFKSITEMAFLFSPWRHYLWRHLIPWIGILRQSITKGKFNWSSIDALWTIRGEMMGGVKGRGMLRDFQGFFSIWQNSDRWVNNTCNSPAPPEPPPATEGRRGGTTPPVHVTTQHGPYYYGSRQCCVWVGEPGLYWSTQRSHPRCRWVGLNSPVSCLRANLISNPLMIVAMVTAGIRYSLAHSKQHFSPFVLQEHLMENYE